MLLLKNSISIVQNFPVSQSMLATTAKRLLLEFSQELFLQQSLFGSLLFFHSFLQFFANNFTFIPWNGFPIFHTHCSFAPFARNKHTVSSLRHPERFSYCLATIQDAPTIFSFNHFSLLWAVKWSVWGEKPLKHFVNNCLWIIIIRIFVRHKNSMSTLTSKGTNFFPPPHISPTTSTPKNMKNVLWFQLRN